MNGADIVSVNIQSPLQSVNYKPQNDVVYSCKMETQNTIFFFGGGGLELTMIPTTDLQTLHAPPSNTVWACRLMLAGR